MTSLPKVVIRYGWRKFGWYAWVDDPDLQIAVCCPRAYTAVGELIFILRDAIDLVDGVSLDLVSTSQVPSWVIEKGNSY